MISYQNEMEHGALVRIVREAYMELFPTASIEDRLDALEPGAYVAVTCSPSKGVDETLQMTTRLSERGFKVVPHIAAKMVRDRAHLKEIMAWLADLPVDSIFVPGGDAPKALGTYARAVELLRDIADIPHRFRHVGIGAHPEGHPDVTDEVLLSELEKKQPLSTYMVTQLCFDAELLDQWLQMVRGRGIKLPAFIGIPGVSDRASLLKTSLRIGVGDSLRFLKRKSDAARHLMQSSSYSPDGLLSDMAATFANPDRLVVGCHIYCFNQVEKTEQWRHQALSELGQAPKSGAG
jgi:methylenetetrahydrofolate reductase (NADPH)